MIKNVLTVAVLAGAMLFSSCYTMTHTVGNGASGNNVTTQKQWYVIGGLVPLMVEDSKEIAAGATDYTVETKQSFVDILINGITGGIIAPQTITVTK